MKLAFHITSALLYSDIVILCVIFCKCLTEQLKMIVVCIKGQIVSEDYMTNEAADCVSLVSESYPQQLGPV